MYSEEVKTNALVNSAGSDLSWEEVHTFFKAMSVVADNQKIERYYDDLDSTLALRRSGTPTSMELG